MKTVKMTMIALSALLSTQAAFAASSDFQADFAQAKADNFGVDAPALLPASVKAELSALLARCLVTTPAVEVNGVFHNVPTYVKPSCAGLITTQTHAAADQNSFETGKLVLPSGTVNYIAMIAQGLDTDNQAVRFYDAGGNTIGADNYTIDTVENVFDFLAIVGTDTRI